MTLTITFTGREKLTPQQIWEFLDDAIQDRLIEFNGDEYHITVEKSESK